MIEGDSAAAGAPPRDAFGGTPVGTPTGSYDGAGATPARRDLRDRHGRGMRGPELLPGLLPHRRQGRPRPTRRERFDALVLGIVTEVDGRWQDRLGLVEYAVEDTPLVPDDWSEETVPLSSLIRGAGTSPSRLVLFRRPIERRSPDREALEALVFTIVVEQVAELLGMDAEDVDPRYQSGD